MVNVAGRSRGCATCRKRKVKCDETFPRCGRCVTARLQCPGPRTGSFYIHAVPTASTASSESFVSRKLASGIRLPGPQPCRASVFDQLFVSHFIETFFGTMRSPPGAGQGGSPKVWLHELPNFMVALDSMLAKHAIRAASMIGYGTEACDKSICTEARTWYGKALQDLRTLFSSGRLHCSEAAICAITMLIHFESRAGTSWEAWIQHIKGATVLMELAGPEEFRYGFMHEIFVHLRFQVFVAGMATNQASLLASLDWMTIPYQVHPKSMFDHLNDILFGVQSCLVKAKGMVESEVDVDNGKITSLHESIERTLHEIQTQSVWIKTSAISPPCPRDFPTTFLSIPQAAISSLFSAANLITLRLLNLVAPLTSTCRAQSLQHAQNIISAGDFINAVGGPKSSRASIIILLQLKIASLWSPLSEIKGAALRMLEEHKVQVGGLNAITDASNGCFAELAYYIHQKFDT